MAVLTFLTGLTKQDQNFLLIAPTPKEHNLIIHFIAAVVVAKVPDDRGPLLILMDYLRPNCLPVELGQSPQRILKPRGGHTGN